LISLGVARGLRMAGLCGIDANHGYLQLIRQIAIESSQRNDSGTQTRYGFQFAKYRLS